jgi:hypothetical protein
MYKDKDKQRKAVKLATRRYRKRKGITEVSQKPVILTQAVIPDECDTVIPCIEPDTGYQRNYEIQAHKPEPQSTNPMKVGYVPPVE